MMVAELMLSASTMVVVKTKLNKNKQRLIITIPHIFDLHHFMRNDFYCFKLVNDSSCAVISEFQPALQQRSGALLVLNNNARSVIEQRVGGNQAIIGMMVESYLKEGNQPFPRPAAELCYGVSITDACLGWEATARMLYWAQEQVAQKTGSVPLSA